VSLPFQICYQGSSRHQNRHLDLGLFRGAVVGRRRGWRVRRRRLGWSRRNWPAFLSAEGRRGRQGQCERNKRKQDAQCKPRLELPHIRPPERERLLPVSINHKWPATKRVFVTMPPACLVEVNDGCYNDRMRLARCHGLATWRFTLAAKLAARLFGG